MLAQAVVKAPHLVSPELTRVAGISREIMAAAEIFGLISAMSESFASAMVGHDVFLCPTMTVAAVPASQSTWDTGFTIDGTIVDPEFGYSTTHQFNLLSNCPAISVPSGWTSFGMPTGLQIVGRPFDDLTVFRAALAFEARDGPWFSRPEHRPSDQVRSRLPRSGLRDAEESNQAAVTGAGQLPSTTERRPAEFGADVP
jgi:amidase